MTGRPPIYADEDVALFEAKVQLYLDEHDGTTFLKIPTLAGLALELGFNARQTLAEYEKREAFTNIVSRARAHIEIDRNRRLVSKEHYTPGLPMDLANHHGYVTNKNEHAGPQGGPIAVSKIEWSITKASEEESADG